MPVRIELKRGLTETAMDNWLIAAEEGIPRQAEPPLCIRMALLLQEHASGELDMLKVVTMLLIHDIPEIDAGDTWLYDPDQAGKIAAETRAAKRLYALLPGNQHNEFLDLWREFEAQQSAEARFATAIDGLQPLLNHLLTGNPSDGVVAIDQVYEKKSFIKDHAPDLWSLVEKLIEKSVERGLYA